MYLAVAKQARARAVNSSDFPLSGVQSLVSHAPLPKHGLLRTSLPTGRTRKQFKQRYSSDPWQILQPGSLYNMYDKNDFTVARVPPTHAALKGHDCYGSNALCKYSHVGVYACFVIKKARVASGNSANISLTPRHSTIVKIFPASRFVSHRQVRQESKKKSSPKV